MIFFFSPTRGKPRYLLRDDFTDTVAAGSVNGTLATPTGGERTVTDGNNKLSIGSGVVSLATGGVGAGDPGIWEPSQARLTGKVLVAKVTPTTARSYIGFDANTTSTPSAGALLFRAATSVLAIYDATEMNCGAITPGTAYQVAIIARAAGLHYFIKGGAFTNWTFLYPANVKTDASLYPTMIAGDTTTVATADFIRVPQNLIYIVPLASDGFGGTWGTTGGAGSEEGGGTGLTWTAQKGTFGSAAGVASCSALTDTLGIATVPVGTQNVMVEAVVTRSAGNAGLTLRWTDINNYIAAYLDGTNLVVVEVVDGTPNTLATTAVTYGATKRLIASCNATKLRFYYGEAMVGAELTTAITTGNAHGLYTSDTGATFDNFVCWAKGNGGEYEGAFNKYTS